MAKPIEPTPILTGKDARDFLQDFNATKLTRSVARNLKRCERIYEAFQAKLTSSANARQYKHS